MINPRFGSYYQGNLPSSTGGGNPYGNLIMAGLGMGYDAYQQNQQRKANIRQENRARAWNRQMWEDINEYNHPINQMARLAEAGLNPNLIYGSSPGSAVGNAGQIHPGKAPEQKYSNIVSPAISQFQNLRVQQAQSNNLNTSAMKNIAESNLSTTRKNQLEGLFSGILELQNESIQQSKFETAKKRLENLAISNEKKGLLAKYLAEVETAMLARDQKDLEMSMYKYKDTLYQSGVKPEDPIQVRAMATLLGLDLSKPLTKDQAQKVIDFMKNPWDYLTTILGINQN